MKRHVYSGALAALTTMLFGFTAADPSIAVAYCASINTATTSSNSSTYQSEGLCYQTCTDGGYALGVLSDTDCWCSNYVPDSDDRVDVSECENACPGYPTDYCGGDNLYGYIKLDAAVSGTAGAGSSTASATSTSTSSAETTSSSSSAETTTSAKTTTDAKSSATIMTSVQTVTSEGSVTTQTIVTTAYPAASSNSGLSKGAIAGLVVGILALVAAFVASAILYRRLKQNQRRMEEAPLAATMDGSHRRGSSVGIMSKAGTISSAGYGLPMEEDMGYASPGRRMSMKPMDPRLDPKQTFGLYRAASHDSINTIRDDQDYSRRVHDAPRVLRVTNSDPTDDN